MLGFLKQLSGWLLKINSVPYNRLIKGHTVSGSTDWTDKAYVDLQSDNNIAALMARMGMVIIPTNIALTGFPNPIAVNGRNYTLVTKQRVLLINQTTSTQNGVYEVVGSNLARVNDYEALNGIIFNSNQIGLKRWVNAANALTFNGSGEAQVRVKNSGQVGGQDVFTGWQVEPTTGELYTLFNSLPGANGSLTIEDYLGTILGIASKVRFSNKFSLVWDGGNTRATIDLNTGGVVPIGAIVYDAFNPSNPTVPAEYALCDGQTVDGNTYPTLLAKLGNTFITNPAINYGAPMPAINLTSSNVSGYIVTSSLYDTGGGNMGTDWHAFDNNATTWAALGSTAHHITIQLPSAFRAERVLLNKSVDGTSGATWNFQGSNNGSSWTTLMSANSATQQSYASNTNLYFTLNTGLGNYLYYRMQVTANAAAGGGKGLGVQNLRFLGADLSPIRYFQVPNLPNLATNVRPIIKL